jgi:hypothetical protein
VNILEEAFIRGYVKRAEDSATPAHWMANRGPKLRGSTSTLQANDNTLPLPMKFTSFKRGNEMSSSMDLMDKPQVEDISTLTQKALAPKAPDRELAELKTPPPATTSRYDYYLKH